MKKLLTLSICIMLILSLSLVGCSKEVELTDKEKYEKVIEVSSNLESAKMEFDATMNVEMVSDNEETNSELDLVAGMFENLKMSGSAEYMKTDRIGDLAMLFQIEMNGMSFDIEMYFDGDKIIINYPMMPDYIVIDMNEIIGMLNDTGEVGFELDYETIIANLDSIMEDITTISKDVMFDNLADEDIEYISEYTFNFNDEEVVSEAIKLNINIENMADYMLSVLEKSKDVESFRSLVDLINTEEEVTMDVYNAYIDTAIEEMKTSENEILAVYDNMTINQYELIFGYDEEYNMNYYDQIMAYDMYDEQSEMTIKFDMKMSAKVTDHNSITEITIPEMTEENSINFMELMGGMY